MKNQRSNNGIQPANGFSSLANRTMSNSVASSNKKKKKKTSNSY